MPSRKIDDLIPAMRMKAAMFAAKMASEGVPFIITCTRRTQAEQDELYARGRTKPGRKVTWTRKSRHIDGEAFDICICKDGVPQWDGKVDVDLDGVPDYFEAGQIGESCGLVWGGRWKSPDFPHFEMPKEA
ncbi:MAG: M15 family metallopeptidase [Candidatus Peribacteraceae bacterium]|jgi:peptidoglycan L-alanyl-D-glutamate endopeptidase CwlK